MPPQVCTDYLLLTGLNNNAALIQYGMEHPNIVANKDSCPMAKETLVQFFARQLIMEMGGIDGIDLDGDGHVSEEEVAISLSALYASDRDGAATDGSKHAGVSDAMVSAVMTEIEDLKSASQNVVPPRIVRWHP